MSMRIGQSVGLVLAVAGTVGGALLVGLGFGYRAHIVTESRFTKESIAERDLGRLRESVHAWLVIGDLVLSGGDTHLADLADRAGEDALKLAVTLETSSGTSIYGRDFGLVREAILAQERRLLEARLLRGPDREARLSDMLSEFDSSTQRLTVRLDLIRDAISRQLAESQAEITHQESLLRIMSVLSIVLYTAMVYGLWRWSVTSSVRPLEALFREARDAASTGRPFRLEPSGPVEVFRITESLDTLSDMLDQRMVELDAANRSLDVANQRLAQSNETLIGDVGASKHTLRLFSTLGEELSDIQDIDVMLDRALRGLRELLGATGAAAYLVEQGESVLRRVDCPQMAGDGPSEHASRLSRLLPDSTDPTPPRTASGPTQGQLALAVHDNTGNTIALLRAVDPVVVGTTDPRMFDEVDVRMGRSLAALLGVNLQRAWLIRSILDRMIEMAEMRDPDETAEHVRRVAELAVRLFDVWAQHKGWPVAKAQRTRDMLRIAAMLHDVGKVAVPDRVLRKAGPLDEHERTLMRAHTEAGARLFESRTTPHDATAREVAMHHHQRWDGKGYPEVDAPDGTRRPLRGEEIPIEARIVTVADVIDALLSERVYKQAWSLADALAEIRAQSGKHFDPELVSLLDVALSDPLVMRSLGTSRIRE
ncbi:MAG: HD domain-containing protein [Planctomycetota bacterium]|nr:HD domain-containing protein [Planctomycetota bacterium]